MRPGAHRWTFWVTKRLPRAFLLCLVGIALFFGSCETLLWLRSKNVTTRYHLQNRAAPRVRPWPRHAGDRGDFLIYEDESILRAVPSLQSAVQESNVDPINERKSRVLIASLQVLGPIVNGGIGTAVANLAETLRADGHHVTLLYLGEFFQSGTLQEWVEKYNRKGIELVVLPPAPVRLVPSTPSRWVSVAYRTYRYLLAKQADFDTFHFHDWHGPGYYVALAKHQGIAFQNVQIVSTLHCPAMFYASGSASAPARHDDIVSDFLERRQIIFSDVVLSPSRFMLRWVQGRGWELPERTYFAPNLLGSETIKAARNPNHLIARASKRPMRVNELVFFGRLERLKGLFVFLDALDALFYSENLKNRAKPIGSLSRVTFLGHENLHNSNVSRLIRLRAKRGGWPLHVGVHTLQHDRAIAYLSTHGRVPIMPSLAENSPYAVLECLSQGIPFIASDVGGVSELIFRQDWNTTLVKPDVSSLAKALKRIVTRGHRSARPAFDPTATKMSMLALHRRIAPGGAWRPARRAPVGPGSAHATPSITVCITHRNRGNLLVKTMGAVLAQKFTDFEIVLVDDGSSDPESLRVLRKINDFFGSSKTGIPFRMVRTRTRFPGAARNLAARLARGEFVAFCDDDDVPRPEWLGTLLRVARHTQAEIITCMSDFFGGNSVPLPEERPSGRWLTLGPAVALGMFHNVFGSSQALVRRAAFLNSGGFSEEGESTYEDWEFFAGAVLRGMRLENVPDALSLYRQHTGVGREGFASEPSLRQTTNAFRNRMRMLRPYQRLVPSGMRNALLYAWGRAVAVDAEAAKRARMRIKG